MFDFLKIKNLKNHKKLKNNNNIKKNNIEDLAVQTCLNNNFSNSSHPFDVIQKYKPLSIPEIKLYKSLREAVPIIDAAISKIIRLVGEFKIKCPDNIEIENLLNKFVNNIQVNSCERGINSFILSHLNQLLTYGTAVGEIVINPEDNSIQALYNACLSDVKLTTKNSPLNLLVLTRNKNNMFEPIKYPELVLISSLNPEPGNIYGNSIMKGLPFVSNILLKIFYSIGVNWERVGNVRFAVTYKPNSDSNNNSEKLYSKERAAQIASEWSKAMNNNTPSDFIAIGDVQIKVIGADNQILESQVPVRQMLEQIVSKLSIPPFLLGLNWSSTETMSSQQSEILTSELESYRRLLNPIIQKICDMYLKLNNYYNFNNNINYEISWSKIDLKDQLQTANSRFINAKAQEIEKRLDININYNK